MRAASALTTGGLGGRVLWLAARIAQYRCKSEWTHLSAGCSTSTLATGRSALLSVCGQLMSERRHQSDPAGTSALAIGTWPMADP
jgi:hypothetical protein